MSNWKKLKVLLGHDMWSRNSIFCGWHGGGCRVWLWLPGLPEVQKSSGRLPHSLGQSPGDLTSITNIPGVLFAEIALQRSVVKHWSWVIGMAVILLSGCMCWGFWRVGTWLVLLLRTPVFSCKACGPMFYCSLTCLWNRLMEMAVAMGRDSILTLKAKDCCWGFLGDFFWKLRQEEIRRG